MFHAIRNTISLRDASPKLKRAMANSKLLNSKRQPPNITQMLSRAKLTSNIASSQNHYKRTRKLTKWNNKTCGTCPLSLQCNEIKFKNSNKPFIIKSRMDCTTTNSIYLIGCTGCTTMGSSSSSGREFALHYLKIEDRWWRPLVTATEKGKMSNGKEKLTCKLHQQIKKSRESK